MGQQQGAASSDEILWGNCGTCQSRRRRPLPRPPSPSGSVVALHVRVGKSARSLTCQWTIAHASILRSCVSSVCHVMGWWRWCLVWPRLVLVFVSVLVLVLVRVV